MMRPIRIGISLGDPGGVGPETTARALLDAEYPDAKFIIFTDESLFAEIGRRFRWAAELRRIAKEAGNIRFFGSPQFGGPAPIGAPTPPGAEFAYRSLVSAANTALKGEIDAILTAPLSKKGLNLAGYDYSGNTEILKEICGVDRVVMMLLAGDFRVIPATRHVGLAEVPALITPELIVETVGIAANSLRKYESIANPKIAVLALNPHAGEGGLFGPEENIISNAIEKLCAEGFDVTGPMVPDIAFLPEKMRQFDAFVGMYHDQVLIPLKMAAFDDGVNATLGLPIIRTSPDHGTAYDIAGKDVANPSSTIEAIKLAIRWARAISE